MKKAILWFRQDLRLHDNPALVEACKHFEIIPIYVLDDANAKEAQKGSACRNWLHYSLQSLQKDLNNHLLLFKEKADTLLLKLVKTLDIQAVFWNRCYEPWRIARDKKIKQQLLDKGVAVQSFNASLIWEPWQVLKDDHTPYKIYTPYYKKAKGFAVSSPLDAPCHLPLASVSCDSLPLDKLNLLPSLPWGKAIKSYWEMGEKGAKKRFENFLSSGLLNYKKGRDFPSEQSVSRLSPHLHFGEISPRYLWHRVSALCQEENAEHFLRELAWREFSYYLLYHFPHLPDANLQKSFDAFPWAVDQDKLKAWQKGVTGYPIVDAGMRELWQTGYMHNRVRMIVGSFLVKNLLISWHEGKKWFWDCLCDADLASNSASWQWVAGSGTDAAPYFRVFNPITQGEKFDPEGFYTRKWVPELEKLPKKYLFKPWEAPDDVLKEAQLTLGIDYPRPIVEVKKSREEALAAYQSLKNNAG